MKNKKVVIWDFDGPIIDSWQLAYELTDREFYGITEDIHRNLFNGNVLEEITKLKKKEYTKEEDEVYMENYWKRKLELPVVNDVANVIERISRNYIQVINSSSSMENIQKFLVRHSLKEFFSDIYGREIKSEVEKFELILEKFDVGPDDCVLITDTLGDVLEAKEVGIESIVVTWGYQQRKHFDDVKDQVVFVDKPEGIIAKFK